MKIALASDHGGFDRKEQIKAFLIQNGYEVEDFGTHSKDSCHYPVFGAAAAKAVASGQCDRGIVVCTTGLGMSITANKVKGIRCAMCTDPHAAEMCRRHNNANVIAIGADYSTEETACQMVHTFLHTEFEGGRHQTRVDLMMDLENE